MLAKFDEFLGRSATIRGLLLLSFQKDKFVKIIKCPSLVGIWVRWRYTICHGFLLSPNAPTRECRVLYGKRGLGLVPECVQLTLCP